MQQQTVWNSLSGKLSKMEDCQIQISVIASKETKASKKETEEFVLSFQTLAISAGALMKWISSVPKPYSDDEQMQELRKKCNEMSKICILLVKAAKNAMLDCKNGELKLKLTEFQEKVYLPAVGELKEMIAVLEKRFPHIATPEIVLEQPTLVTKFPSEETTGERETSKTKSGYSEPPPSKSSPSREAPSKTISKNNNSPSSSPQTQAGRTPEMIKRGDSSPSLSQTSFRISDEEKKITKEEYEKEIKTLVVALKTWKQATQDKDAEKWEKYTKIVLPTAHKVMVYARQAAKGSEVEVQVESTTNNLKQDFSSLVSAGRNFFKELVEFNEIEERVTKLSPSIKLLSSLSSRFESQPLIISTISKQTVGGFSTLRNDNNKPGRDKASTMIPSSQIRPVNQNNRALQPSKPPKQENKPQETREEPQTQEIRQEIKMETSHQRNSPKSTQDEATSVEIGQHQSNSSSSENGSEANLSLNGEIQTRPRTNVWKKTKAKKPRSEKYFTMQVKKGNHTSINLKQSGKNVKVNKNEEISKLSKQLQQMKGEKKEIHNAVEQNDTVTVKKLITVSPSCVDERDPKLMTSLHIAVENKNPDMLTLLLQNNPDINARDSRGYTPLHISTLNNST